MYSNSLNDIRSSIPDGVSIEKDLKQKIKLRLVRLGSRAGYKKLVLTCC